LQHSIQLSNLSLIGLGQGDGFVKQGSDLQERV
jgi:hypothetical protein